MGCRPYTQGLDIGFGAHLWVEKALDSQSLGGLAQSDIRTFFDVNPILKCAIFLSKRGVPMPLLAAAVRHQLFSQVYLAARGPKFLVRNRSRGGLTGSRLAMAFGRVPVEASFLDVWDSLLLASFKIDEFRLVGGAYVDNLYFFGHDANAAVHNASLVHDILKQKWELDIKAGSQVLLAPAGADISAIPASWECPAAVTFLGYVVQDDAGIRSAWARCRSKMWQRFFAISRDRGWSKLSIARKSRHVERSIWTLLSFYCGTWPPQLQVSREIDTVQRKMFAAILRVKKLPEEEPVTYVRRRNKLAKNLCNEMGLWSSRWFSKARCWNQHLQRDLIHQRRHVFDNVPVDRITTSFSWACF